MLKEVRFQLCDYDAVDNTFPGRDRRQHPAVLSGIALGSLYGLSAVGVLLRVKLPVHAT